MSTKFLKATHECVFIPAKNGYASVDGENIEVNGYVERLIKAGDLVPVAKEHGAEKRKNK